MIRNDVTESGFVKVAALIPKPHYRGLELIAERDGVSLDEVFRWSVRDEIEATASRFDYNSSERKTFDELLEAGKTGEEPSDTIHKMDIFKFMGSARPYAQIVGKMERLQDYEDMALFIWRIMENCKYDEEAARDKMKKLYEQTLMYRRREVEERIKRDLHLPDEWP